MFNYLIMTRYQLIKFLVEEAEYQQCVVEQWDNFTLIDKYLQYEGICGFTGDIISTVLNLYK